MQNTTKDRLYFLLFAFIGAFWLPIVVAATLWVGWLFT